MQQSDDKLNDIIQSHLQKRSLKTQNNQVVSITSTSTIQVNKNLEQNNLQLTENIFTSLRNQNKTAFLDHLSKSNIERVQESPNEKRTGSAFLPPPAFNPGDTS